MGGLYDPLAIRRIKPFFCLIYFHSCIIISLKGSSRAEISNSVIYWQSLPKIKFFTAKYCNLFILSTFECNCTCDIYLVISVYMPSAPKILFFRPVSSVISYRPGLIQYLPLMNNNTNTYSKRLKIIVNL